MWKDNKCPRKIQIVSSILKIEFLKLHYLGRGQTLPYTVFIGYYLHPNNVVFAY